jgi:hypothetical protein
MVRLVVAEKTGVEVRASRAIIVFYHPNTPIRPQPIRYRYQENGLIEAVIPI